MRILEDTSWLDIEDAIANALSLLEALGHADTPEHDDLQSAHITLLMLNAIEKRDATGANVPFCGDTRSIFAD